MSDDLASLTEELFCIAVLDEQNAEHIDGMDSGPRRAPTKNPTIAMSKPEFIPYIDAANAEISRLHAKIEAAAASKTVGADGACPRAGGPLNQPLSQPPSHRLKLHS